MKVADNITLELVPNTDPRGLLRELANFNYATIDTIEKAIKALDMREARLARIWMFNNHRQPLAISSIYHCINHRDTKIKICVKVFAKDKIDLIIYHKRLDWDGVPAAAINHYSLSLNDFIIKLSAVSKIIMHWDPDKPTI